MRKLSELLSDLELLEKRYQEFLEELEDGEDKDMILTDLELAMDCIGACLMYGDYINDTGKPYNYFED